MPFFRKLTLPFRSAIALAAFASIFGFARAASAQNAVSLSFSASQPDPVWLDAHGTAISPRPVAYNPYGVSFSDCENDFATKFSISVAYPSSAAGSETLQVWAGTSDCTQAVNRSDVSGVVGTCIPVSAATVLTQSSVEVSIFARDVAMAIGGLSPTGVGGVAPFTSVHASGDASCFRQEGSAGITMGLYFLAFPGGVNEADDSISYNAPTAMGTPGTSGILVDLVGPIAPSGGALHPGADTVDVTWAPAPDSDTQGFQLFCDPSPAAADAGSPPFDAQCSLATTLVTGGDAATVGSPSGPCNEPLSFDAGTCSSPLLGAGDENGSQIPPSYRCSPMLAGATNSTYQQTNVVAGTEYAYAVAGYDSLLNIGAVDVIGCADPDGSSTEVGGGGGGGGCAIDAVRAPLGSTAFLGGLAVGAIVLARRRAANQRRASN